MASSHVNEAAIKRFLESPDGPTFRWLIRFTNRVRNGAVIRANVRTGRMVGSIEVTFRLDSMGPVGRVGTDVSYARFVHEGTKPHIIYPNGAKALRYVGSNGVVFARKVNHPGYGGNPFLRDALQDEVRAL